MKQFIHLFFLTCRLLAPQPHLQPHLLLKYPLFLICIIWPLFLYRIRAHIWFREFNFNLKQFQRWRRLFINHQMRNVKNFWGFLTSSFAWKHCSWSIKSNPLLYNSIWSSFFGGLFTGSSSNGKKRSISSRLVVGKLTYSTVCTFWVTDWSSLSHTGDWAGLSQG